MINRVYHDPRENDGGAQMIGDSTENLAQLIAIRSVVRGWQKLDTIEAGKQIAPIDYQFVDALKVFVPVSQFPWFFPYQ